MKPYIIFFSELNSKLGITVIVNTDNFKDKFKPLRNSVIHTIISDSAENAVLEFLKDEFENYEKYISKFEINIV